MSQINHWRGSTVNVVDGRNIRQLATVQECQVQCVDSRTFCYGLDYSRTSQTCFLIHTVGYELQPIGKIDGTDNYRRILTANGEFSVTMSSGGSGGCVGGLPPPPPHPQVTPELSQIYTVYALSCPIFLSKKYLRCD